MIKVNAKKMNVLDLIRTLTLEIESAKPTKEKMLQDIKMMNFKVRPVSGDIFSITQKEIHFMESLWKLGKVEEMMRDRVDGLEDDEKEVFFNYLEDLQNRTQEDIASAIADLPKKEQKSLKMVELEIFKERSLDKAKLN